MADKIAEILAPIAKSKGAKVVSVEYGGKTLRVLVEGEDYSSLPLAKIEELSRLFSAQLDVEDAISERYFLEVSSPGMERPIITREDWEHFTGREAAIEFREPVDGARHIRAKISSEIDFNNVLRAKLAVSDEDIRNILKERKKKDG
ncbi:MAG: ribosome maturation factor RimP [Rickettsiales bacterium]|nr:ribosome maturation factor RimP [Rickettsiales bacterium]